MCTINMCVTQWVKEPNDMEGHDSRLRWKWLLGVIGMLVGLGRGVAGMARVYSQGPGRPGVYELIVQLILVMFAGVVLGIAGFVIGWGIDLVARKKSG